MNKPSLAIIIFFLLISAACGGGGGGGGGEHTTSITACEALDSRLQVFGGEVCPSAGGGPVHRLFIIAADGGTGFCTAVSINASTVLTSAHCVRGEIAVVAGSDSYRATSVQIHPGYDGEVENRPFDIAAIGFSDSIFPTFLPLLVSEPSNVGDDYFFFGYGQSDASTDPTELEEGLSRPLIGAQLSIERIFTNDGFGMFGSSFEESRATVCSGDSGGPAVKSVNGKLAIIGIVSRAFNMCTEEGISLFVNTQQPEILDFITTATGGNVTTL